MSGDAERRPAEILLVDDDPEGARGALVVFGENDLGDCVQVATSAEEALRILAGSDAACAPRLVVLSAALPDGDGLELLRRMREDWHTSGLPALVLVTSEEERDLVERTAPGVTAAIVRPLDFAKFVASAGAVSLYWRSRAEATAGRP